MVRRFGLLLMLVAACVPDLEDTSALVAGPRLLAVAMDPPEASAGAQVVWRALDVTPEGPAARPIDWALCQLRKPVSEAGPINPACLSATGPATTLSPLGAGPSVAGRLPSRACQVFGPETPSPKPGEPQAREVDPDSTGGFYQPLRLRLGDTESYGTYDARVRCALNNVNPQQANQLQTRSHPNTNPILTSFVVINGDGSVVPLVPIELADEARASIPAGQPQRLRATWGACPAVDACGDGFCGVTETQGTCAADCQNPKPCGGAEPYLWFNPATRELVPRREVMRASWFASAGTFDTGRTGRSEEEWSIANTENTWIPPTAPGTVARVWIVLRDDRGGATWLSFVFGLR